MKNRTTGGIVLLVIAAVAGVLWWRNRQAAAGVIAEVDGEKAQLDSLDGVQQVGSNFTQNVTADAVKVALQYAADIVRDTGPCWERFRSCDDHGNEAWRRSDNHAITTNTPCGGRPETLRAC
jgi:hypothetical protein